MVHSGQLLRGGVGGLSGAKQHGFDNTLGPGRGAGIYGPFQTFYMDRCCRIALSAARMPAPDVCFDRCRAKSGAEMASVGVTCGTPSY